MQKQSKNWPGVQYPLKEKDIYTLIPEGILYIKEKYKQIIACYSILGGGGALVPVFEVGYHLHISQVIRVVFQKTKVGNVQAHAYIV